MRRLVGRDKWAVGVGAVVLVAGMATAAVVSSAVLAPPASATIGSSATSAVSYANQHGYRSSIGVIDTASGTFSGAGDYSSAYASESVMKVFIATRLLMTGQMTGWNASTAYKMITQSDDASANALYGRTGGDGVITWIKQELNIPNLGSPPLRSGWWGGTQITAAGMAQFYNVIRHRSDVWPWLGNAMHHATTYGSDGTYQYFGIPSATTGFGVKQGWGGDNAAGQPAFNSTGFVNGDRYAVVILTQGGTYGAPIANMVTTEARLLMPGGRIDADSPNGSVDAWWLRGRYLSLTGWAYDPNATSSPLRIVFFVNGKQVTYVATTLARADVNAHFGITGKHGFNAVFALPDGVNTVCADALNLGAGGNSMFACRTFSVTGTPVARIEASTQRGRVSTFTGWALDYDVPSRQMLVRAYVNGRYAAGTYTTVARSDVNSTYHVTGPKGYSLAVPLGTGSNSVCLTVQNIGAGAAKSLGCYRRVVTQSPIGNLQSPSNSFGHVTLNGWALDFDAPSSALTYSLRMNGRVIATGVTSTSRSDVNSTYGVSGGHGFTREFALSQPGRFTFCLSVANVGPGANSTFACKAVVIAAPAAVQGRAPASGDPTPVTSTPGPVSNTPGPVISAPGPVTSPPGPVTSAPSPVTSSPGPATSAPGPATSPPALSSSTPTPSESSAPTPS